ncbi:enoyl-CoA hydratase/isomerase family protein [Microbacterium sp. RD1]|uniref:enoyl-CoA hydratase/isomerase family protein n=1 Tax=Microbacterium sp. RD1 TaxID=3457313 RepID=UPI003FA5CBEB
MSSHVEDATVVQEKRGHGLWLRLNRPRALNSLNQDTVDALHAGLDAAAADREVRAVVIGSTGRVFCAGADLEYVRSVADQRAADGTSGSDAFLKRARTLLDRIESFGKPVVAAVNGVAVGGGLELILVCDLAIAARSAMIGDGHAVYGQIPGGGASLRLVRRLGLGTAKHLMFTGDMHPAEWFGGTDLLVDVVDPEELDTAVERLVDTLASRSPLGLRAMKSLANDAHDTVGAVALTRELEALELHRQTEDWKEGIDAFAHKRTPTFLGR